MKKFSIWLIIIGLILLVVDYRIPTGTPYPEFGTALELGTVFQAKVIQNFIGSSPTFDIFNDLLGYAFIFIGAMLLVTKSKKFILALLLVPIAVILYITIPTLPFNFELEDLYLKAAGYNFTIVFVQILIEYFVIYGIVDFTNCLQNKWHNNEVLGGWIVSMMSKALLILIQFFYGFNLLFYIYYFITIGATIFYINRLMQTLKHVPEEKSNE